ncbi:hypothetical protein [Roseateles sp. BYS87W]|uniref:Uncharacterized protein n=1 Tax=Pelomonas baiyunensis TaxID=3299026 RepID=A0ABW7H4Z2_9BURK
MRRGFTTILLMLCLCWQALAHAGVAVLMTDAGEPQHEHAVMHFEGEAHHHDHDTGHDGDASDATHADHSLASAQHLANDASLCAPALLGVTDLTLPSLPPQMPAAAPAATPPSACLAGPERPPKHRS